MNPKKMLLLAIPMMAIGSLTGCGQSYDVKLVIYNWADYIYTGEDEEGNLTDKSTITRFQEYYQEKYDKVLKVQYRTFSTPEIMYGQIKAGRIKPDLICPSDYMIQKMANEGMLEKFSYNESTATYGDSLKNFQDYGSPFIKERFSEVKLNDSNSFLTYSVPYFWGTMGFTYDPDYFTEDEIGTWEALWSKESKFQKQLSLKDSMRDSYVTAIFHVYKDEIAQLDEESETYNQQLTEIFNRCDDNTLSLVEAALKEASRTTVNAFEVDEGKNEIVKGTYHANLAWSGDAIYAMDSAEEGDKRLNYALPKEGSNVWFDGWCMPKGAQVDVAEEFVNFISNPEIAALNMNAVGYTSPIVGTEMWDLVNDWYAADEEETDTYSVDLSFYFGEDAIIDIPTSEKGRQFDAQYPTEEVLKKCCMMNDFGSQQEKVQDMWLRVKA
ncbi:MAG: extracellular solute-binding protein [Bacilli bacterium]|nr:extracellular solute-binding protein [Bacilli bacterium]